jgi:hypothetical protein
VVPAQKDVCCMFVISGWLCRELLLWICRTYIVSSVRAVVEAVILGCMCCCGNLPIFEIYKL